MQDHNQIAEKLDTVIRQMLINCKSLSPALQEYLVFCNPDEKDAQWFVLVFFRESVQLNEAIRNGVCYQIHQYMWSNLSHIDDFRDLRKAIFFESGILPKEETGLDEICANAVGKLDALTKEVDQQEPKICSLCGHDLNKHQMVGIPDEATGVPSAGWMVCPEVDCNCFRTWSITIVEK